MMIGQLYGQSSYTLKKDKGYHVLFVNNNDTVDFRRSKKLVTVTGHHVSYKIKSNYGYYITDTSGDSLKMLYRDLPYGELIINYLPGPDQASHNIIVNRLDCVASINGTEGNPQLDMTAKTIDTEKLKKSRLGEIVIKANGNMICSGKRNGTQVDLQFNTINSPWLNERLKIAMMLVFWIYEK